MLCESCKRILYKRLAIIAGITGVGAVLAGAGAVLAARGTQHVQVRAAAPVHVHAIRPRAAAVSHVQRPAKAKPKHVSRNPKPSVAPRATISLYEHTTNPGVLARQGCRAARRGVSGIVILDFGKPAYNGHTYGTILFSNRFAGNKEITRGLFGYARGYVGCVASGMDATISLARGTSNYHPSVPSPYRAGRKWARETMALQHLLRVHGLDRRVTSAAADDVEPAWDRTFWRTRDFYRGYRSARVGHLLYNYGSLDGGVAHGIWNARQAFFVASGMRYSRAIPEIYNHAMAREWAYLARVARRRYHRPVKFAGVMTTHTSANHGLKPLVAHSMLRRALTASVGHGPDSYVPPSLTNITSAD